MAKDDDQSKRLDEIAKFGEEQTKIARGLLDTFGTAGPALIKELKADREQKKRDEERQRQMLVDRIEKIQSMPPPINLKVENKRKALIFETKRMIEKIDDVKAKQDIQNKNNAKILGVSERRLKTIQKNNQELEDQKQVLATMEDRAKELNIDVKKLPEYAKEEQKLERMKQRQEMAGGGLTKRLGVEFKILGKRFQDGFAVVKDAFGPEAKIFKALFNVADGLKTKVVGGLSSAFGLLKKGLFIGALVALNAFLKSPRFAEIKEKLVPALAKGFEKISNFISELKKSLERIFGAFFGENGSLYGGINQIITELFGDGDQGLSGSLRRVLNSFLGPEGGFVNGIKQSMKEIFGDNYEEQTWYKGIMLIVSFFKTLGRGVGALAEIFTGEDGVFSLKSFEVIKENFGAIALAIGAILLLFRKKVALILTLAKGAANIGFKALKGLGIAGKAGIGAGKAGIGAVKAAPAAIKAGAGKVGDIAKAGAGIAKTGAGKVADVGKTLGKFVSKYPRLVKVAKKVPILGTALTAGMAATILAGSGSNKEKAKELGGFLGGTLGTAGMASIGALLGSVIPGPGTLVGGLIGGLAGGLFGDRIGRILAGFLLGDESEEEKELKKIQAEGGGAPTGTRVESRRFTTSDPRVSKISPTTDQAMAKSARADAIAAGSIDSTANVAGPTINVVDAKTNNMSNMQNVNAAAHSIEDTDMMAKTLSQQPI